MEKLTEIQNQIIRVEADIDQMKNTSIFNEMEQRDRLKKLGEELEELLLKKAKLIESKEETQL